MRVLVCGGRHVQDADSICREVVRLHTKDPITVLIHGCLAGAGMIAEAWGRRNGIAIVRYPPNWEFYGKKAEGLRNGFMIADSRADLVLAFPGGRHTADLVQRAADGNIAVLEIAPTPEDKAIEAA